MAWLRNNGTVARAAWGTLRATECPQQTTLDAELYAMAMANQHTEHKPEIVTDSQAAMDLLRQGPRACDRPDQPRVHLLRKFWAGGPRVVRKIKSHLTEGQAAMQQIPWLHWRGNAIADALAAEAVKVHPHADTARALREVNGKLVELASWAAVQVELAFTDEALQDHDGLPRVEATDTQKSAKQGRREKRQ
eukprot:3409978-Amphidinium_carterae.3